MNVLVLNSGSSSLKFQLIATDPERIKNNTDVRLCRGAVEGLGGEAIITIQKQDDAKETLTAPLKDLRAALDYVVHWIASEQSGIEEIQSLGDVHAIGHRVVHGGELFVESAVITDEVLRGIE